MLCPWVLNLVLPKTQLLTRLITRSRRRVWGAKSLRHGKYRYLTENWHGPQKAMVSNHPFSGAMLVSGRLSLSLSFSLYMYILYMLVGVSNVFYFHLYLGKWSDLTTVIFVAWFETTNYSLYIYIFLAILFWVTFRRLVMFETGPTYPTWRRLSRLISMDCLVGVTENWKSPKKLNMEPKNGVLEDYFPFQTAWKAMCPICKAIVVGFRGKVA